ncbi:hypothetical protein L208DRAFT_1262033 [Tricholoma matsutake]|nr:hypothetical protein L208DRAFT_1262033 [Tricholoma matsutake 945]
MDPSLQPPLRIQPLSSSSISTKHAQRRIGAFLDDFQARSTASQGGNTAVTVQLQKLKDALREERHKKNASIHGTILNLTLFDNCTTMHSE